MLFLYFAYNLLEAKQNHSNQHHSCLSRENIEQQKCINKKSKHAFKPR